MLLGSTMIESGEDAPLDSGLVDGRALCDEGGQSKAGLAAAVYSEVIDALEPGERFSDGDVEIEVASEAILGWAEDDDSLPLMVDVTELAESEGVIITGPTGIEMVEEAEEVEPV